MVQSHNSSNRPFGICRRKFICYGSMTLGSSIITACSGSGSSTNSPSASPAASTSSLDKATFGTNWYAEAEHGGFYQAVAKGIYKEHGLDVTIKMGGPQVNGTQLLMAGAIDFFMGYGADAIKSVESGIPKVTVAAIFQKDPQALIAHPNVGVKTLSDLKGKPILVSAVAYSTFWPFLKSKYGFTSDQIHSYNFNPGPFLADKNVAQQGYITSEPYAIEKIGGFKPIVFLLADFGYQPYATTIETRKELVNKNPNLVQRFVDASIKGWYSYLENPAPGNELIKKDNPQMRDDQLAYGLSKLKEYKIITGGDAATKGIGAMTDQRWQSFFNSMVQGGVFKPNTDYKQAYTMKFADKGVQAYKA
ncbi:MAG: ABC transporter substrate-binding protein [Chroococcidiopsidaceae cyanobacterium CP_BM_ER_R8_30]|nr:ABC transporter substrate-binding protein [Chroococcidiopsidaceae cyanobacterium CP_BM_ER_R8_30]